MKYVITVMSISIGLTQYGLIVGLRRNHFIMKLMDLLIREANNCRLGGNFRVSHYAKLYQFDRLSLEINSKEHVVVIIEFSAWVQVEKYTIKGFNVIMMNTVAVKI